jgi:hypothetical protein
MRRLAITISIIGAAAFVALLAWGLTFGSGTAQANDESPTPTPTVEATETPTATPAELPCTPPFPGTFHGTVTIDGAPAPDGVTITALIDGTAWGTATTSDGTYTVTIPEPVPQYPPCFPGVPATTVVSFQCDSVSAAETAIYNPSAGVVDANLTCGPLATPVATATPEATATPVATATPTATPEVLPPTGMGGMSGDGGFMWWPLALAAAALTSVAGLLTARWARR